MNIRDLEYLLAVAKYRHFGKAAEACHVSQPALSAQLKKLESTLGVQLLERTNKKVLVTPIGYKIIEHAEKLLECVQEIQAVADAYKDPMGGALTLGCFPSLAPYLLPLIVQPIVKSHSNLKLILVEEQSSVLIDQLQSGALDMALIAHPIKAVNLEYCELFEDEFFLAVAKTHSLAKRKTVQRSDLKKLDLYLLTKGHCLRDQSLEVSESVTSLERQDFSATSLETLRHMVVANGGATLMPNLVMKKNDGLVYIPFDINPPSRKICLVWRKSSVRKQCFKSIANQIIEIQN